MERYLNKENIVFNLAMMASPVTGALVATGIKINWKRKAHLKQKMHNEVVLNAANDILIRLADDENVTIGDLVAMANEAVDFVEIADNY